MDYIITSGITSNGITLENADTMTILDGGVVNYVTANSDCEVLVSSGGTANIMFINNGMFQVFNGGTASQTVLTGNEELSGQMKIGSGGSADAVMLSAYTELIVSSGAKVTNIIWTPCVGHVSVFEGGEAVFFSKYTGVYYGTGNSLLSSAASMERKTVDSGNEMYVMSDGIVSRTTVNESGLLVVRGGTATNTTLYAGDITVSSGGEAESTTLYAGEMNVSSGGTANNVSVLNNGVINILAGGAANSVTATDAGIVVSSDGKVNGFTIRGSGGIYAASYSELTGRMVLSSEASFFIEHSAKIDFNISALTPGAPVRINNFSVISGWESANYTITISDSQANGSYSLAIGFPEFERSISVFNTSGEYLDALAVGETKNIGGEDFTLKVVDNTLILKKGKEDDPQPVRPDGGDGGWNNWLYDKKDGLNTDVTDAAPVAIGPETTEVCPDGEDGIAYEENETVYHNFVGKDDEIDYVKISLEKGAKLSFSLAATDAAKFVIWKLTGKEDKKGVVKYSVKSLQSTTLKKNKETGIYYTAQTASMLLEAGEYYVSMQSTNAKKGSAYYNIELAPEDNTYFVRGDNSDDWTDLKTKGAEGAVGDAGTLDASMTSVIADEWVGFGDAVDYKKITLDSAAKLSFTVEAGAAVKYTLWSISGKTDKKGVTTWSLKSLQSVKISKADGTGKFTATTATLFLENPGAYYISVESTDAAKGASADYTVALDKAGTVFFTDADNHVNDWLYDKKTKTPNPDDDSFVLNEITVATNEVLLDTEGSVAYTDAAGTAWHNFVGYDDIADYAVIKLASAANLVFQLSAMDASKFTIWSFTSTTDKKGNVKYTLKSLQSTTLKKAKNATNYEAVTKSLSLAAGSYYISMESTNASKGGAAYYNVALDTEKSRNLPTVQDASALSGCFSAESSALDACCDFAFDGKQFAGWQELASLA